MFGISRPSPSRRWPWPCWRRRRAGRWGRRRSAACRPSRPPACLRRRGLRRRRAGPCPVRGWRPPGRRRRRCLRAGAAGEALASPRRDWGCAPGRRTTLSIVLRSQAFVDARAERFVEVGAHGALRVGPRERVAGAALGDELLLAHDQVGVGLALDRAPRAEERKAASSDETPAGRNAGCAPKARVARHRSGPSEFPLHDIGAGTLSERVRYREVVQLPAGGRDHAPRDALPRPVLAHGRRRAPRASGAQLEVGSQPADEAGSRAPHRSVVDRQMKATAPPRGARARRACR